MKTRRARTKKWAENSLNCGLHVYFGETGNLAVAEVPEGRAAVRPGINLGDVVGVADVWPAVVFDPESGHCEEGVAAEDGAEFCNQFAGFCVEVEGVCVFTVGVVVV